jgi:hypothetical protein
MIIRVPVSGYGAQTQVGTPVKHVDAPGVDDFAFDRLGNIYYTSNPFNQLVKVTPDNEATVLLTADDGINGATAAAFGRLGGRKTLYVTSGAMPFMPPPYNNGQPPSLIAYGNDIAGWPFR